MTDHDRREREEPDDDINDLAAVVRDAKVLRAPRDVVPRTKPAEDAPPLPVGPAEVAHYEVWDGPTPDDPLAGVTKFTQPAWIAKPVTKEDNR
ncbi:MAG: hypothetical protein ACRDNS_12915 [Trebonia sp.]